MQTGRSTAATRSPESLERVQVRPATMKDAEAIYRLVSYHAELGRMLFRSLTNVYEDLRDFLVAERGGQVVGCAAVEVVWRDLGEIKSLAVVEDSRGQGIGRQLVEAGLAEARRLGLERVFSLTRERAFYEKVGFREVPKETLPHKVWTDCIRCPVQDQCDEIAMVIETSR